MRRLFLASLFALFVFTPAAADDLELGRKLVGDFWGAVMAKNKDKLDAVIGEGYQSSNPGGASDRAAGIKRIMGLDIEGAPVFSDFAVTRQGPTVIVTYKVSVSEVLDGKRTDKAPAPRLTVFLMTPKGWQVVAHANFKTAG